MSDETVNVSASAPRAAPPEDGDQEDTRKELLDQFYVTLRTIYVAAGQGAAAVGGPREKLDEIFASTHTWRNAYEIEQLLCFVMTEQQLEIELGRRLLEALALKVPHGEVVEEMVKKGGLDHGVKRILLQRLLNDVQWFYSKREEYRSATKRLMYRVSSLFVVALAALFLVLFIQFFAHPPASLQTVPPPSAAPAPPPPAPDAGAQ